MLETVDIYRNVSVLKSEILFVLKVVLLPFYLLPVLYELYQLMTMLRYSALVCYCHHCCCIGTGYYPVVA